MFPSPFTLIIDFWFHFNLEAHGSYLVLSILHPAPFVFHFNLVHCYRHWYRISHKSQHTATGCNIAERYARMHTAIFPKKAQQNDVLYACLDIYHISYALERGNFSDILNASMPWCDLRVILKGPFPLYLPCISISQVLQFLLGLPAFPLCLTFYIYKHRLASIQCNWKKGASCRDLSPTCYNRFSDSLGALIWQNLCLLIMHTFQFTLSAFNNWICTIKEVFNIYHTSTIFLQGRTTYVARTQTFELNNCNAKSTWKFWLKYPCLKNDVIVMPVFG